MRRLPLLAYSLVYVFTFLVGATLLIAGWSPFEALVHIFTGIRSYQLTSSQAAFDLILIWGSPILFVAGYELCLKRHAAGSGEAEASSRDSVPLAWAYGVWLLTLLVAGVSLARGGAFGRIGTWSNFDAWTGARFGLFGKLSFPEFVNIYTFVPVSTALLAVRLRRAEGPGARRWWIALLPMTAVELLVFQKKLVISALILVFAAVFIDRHWRSGAVGLGKRRVLLPIGVFAGALFLTYSGLVALPAMRARAKSMAEVPEAVPDPELGQSEAVTSSRLKASLGERLPPRWIGGDPSQFSGSSTILELKSGSRPFNLFLYVLMAPLARTAAPALAYPRVYPGQVGFYGFDAAIDTLGLGLSPDDNMVINRFLWPGSREGSIAVPFQFAFYSQVGLGGALVLSLSVGYVLARLWLACFSRKSFADLRSVAAGLVVLLAVFLAMDSVRNSVIVSYGLAWAAILLLLYRLIARADSEKTAKSPSR